MKKFALKQSLESTDFLDLQGLVEAVIQYAHDGGERGAFADPVPAPKVAPKTARKVSLATTARQMSALNQLHRHGFITEERYRAECEELRRRVD